MRLVDTHCHLDFPDYKDDLEEVLKRADEAGVERIIVPGTNVKSSKAAVDMAARHQRIFAAVGIHPHEADTARPSDIAELRKLAVENDKVVAIGEIGLDHYKGYSDPGKQKDLLNECLLLARELDLPVILHNREAGADLLDILKGLEPPAPRGVVHCFSGDAGLLEELIRRDLYVSFTGSITFEKASSLREIIKNVAPEKLLLETDAPFMAPEPLRGKRNEPANVKYLPEVYAGIYGLSSEDIGRITTHNANKLFKLGMEKNGVITYAIRDSLYVNLTNRCTNRCNFCTRNNSYFVKGHDLWLDGEPTADEIIADLGDIAAYKEVVFCGLGEPLLRLGALKKIAAYVKGKGGLVRINTNGEGNLIRGGVVAKDLKGLVDSISVSINARDAENYQYICKSVFGEKAYASILEFIKQCVDVGIGMEVTCLDFLGKEAIDHIREMVDRTGANFRLRHLNVVG